MSMPSNASLDEIASIRDSDAYWLEAFESGKDLGYRLAMSKPDSCEEQVLTYGIAHIIKSRREDIRKATAYLKKHRKASK